MNRTKRVMCFGIAVFLIGAGATHAFEIPSVEHFVRELTPSKKRGPKGMRPESEKPNVIMPLEFRLNRAELTPQTIAYLNNLGQALQDKELRKYVFKLEGHTCDLGNDADNLILSRRRALSVQNYLSRTFQLPKAQFVVRAFGESEPKVPNVDEASRQKNRRVVIRNTLQKFDISQISETQRPSVSARVTYSRNGQLFVMENGDQLTRGDNYAVEFTPRGNVHVYVWQVDPRGKMFLLFPNADYLEASNPVEAGRLYRVPMQGKWLYLDDNAGKENIVIMANKGPLDNADQICRQILGQPVPDHGGTMIADAGGARGVTRGPKGIREEMEVSAPPAAKPARPPEVKTDTLFVWKRYFIHQ